MVDDEIISDPEILWGIPVIKVAPLLDRLLQEH